jgi:putative proteasome-type protease
MTYCIGMSLQDGLVLVSDTRTNAGIDNIARFEKMRVFEKRGERVLVTLSAGNLSVTQNALSLLDMRHGQDGPGDTLWNAASMNDAARMLGEAMREVRQRDEKFLREKNIDPSATFILGGQIVGDAPRLFLVYSEGNYIEAQPDTPYFQIGELKYGKPILDRILAPQSSLDDGLKCALISFDATIRSNLSVGAPLDVLVYRRDSLAVDERYRLEQDDPYMTRIFDDWDRGLRNLFHLLPAKESDG